MLTSRCLPRTLGAVFLVLLAAFVGGCGGEDSGSQTEEAAEQDGAGQNTADTTEAAETDATASIGEPVTVGDVQWTVTAAEQLEELLSNKGDYAQGSFVVVDVTFSNSSNQDVTLATPFFALIDSEGREFEPGIENNFFFLYPEENMFVEPVDPGSTKEGKIIFETEPDSSGLRLQVGEAKFASTETALIDLGL
jgi:Domain of unknown function (DUF4352)